MIRAICRNAETNRTAFIVVLEPGNIEKLRLGSPIHIPIDDNIRMADDVIIAYTPDSHFVAHELMKHGDLEGALKRSLDRQERFYTAEECEAVRKVFAPAPSSPPIPNSKGDTVIEKN